jgi:predicted HD phosphohydrolase
VTGFATLDELVDFLRALEDVPSDEGLPFSELDHQLQCAYELELAAPDDVELQLAGLVHDIAHTVGPIEDHATVGAGMVRPLLGPRVATLVEDHVPAKRYLVTVDPEYRAQLSPDSIRTLALQGGALAAADVERYERRPHWAASVELRRADDRAKTPGRDVPALGHWIPRLRDLLRPAGPGSRR